MSFPRYAEYKDSGVEWLGEVPGHWEVHSLKRRFLIVGGSTPKSDIGTFWDGDIVWVTPADIGQISSLLISDSQRKISAEGLASCGTSLVPAGSILLSTRAPIGSIAIAGTELCINQGCKALVPNVDTGTRFYSYFLSIATGELNVRGKGTTFLELSTDVLGAFPVSFPPLSEQSAIAAFLDCETDKIDALVAEQKKLIALLKEKRRTVVSHAVTKGLDPAVPMKDSGIEWLDKVPEHWAVCAMNYRYEVALGKMLDEKRFTGENSAPYLRNVDVQWARINTNDLPKMDFLGEDLTRYSLETGDLLVCEGGEVGRAAIWEGQLSNCYYQKALHRVRPRDLNCDTNHFLFFVFYAAAMLGLFTGSEAKATIAHLTAETLRRYQFAFPPREEQEAIADFLQIETAKLDTLVTEAQRAIDLLKERRSALISAAVTGKIDVREFVKQAQPSAELVPA